jgi:hypothetical protein
LRDTAFFIQNKLNGYGFSKPYIHPINRSEVISTYGLCPWSSIRYDPDEELAARKLKSIVEKVAPSQTWDLLFLDPKRLEATSKILNHIS